MRRQYGTDVSGVLLVRGLSGALKGAIKLHDLAKRNVRRRDRDGEAQGHPEGAEREGEGEAGSHGEEVAARGEFRVARLL